MSEENKKTNEKSEVFEWVKSIILAIVIAVLIKSFYSIPPMSSATPCILLYTKETGSLPTRFHYIFQGLIEGYNNFGGAR